MMKTVIIDETGEKFLRGGQVWLYSNNVLRVDPETETGDTVAVRNETGDFIAYGFYAPEHHIRVRVLTADEKEIPDVSFFRGRLEKAIRFRHERMKENFSNCRLVFGESDGLPGLVMDRYNDVLVTQISSAGMERIKDMIYKTAEEILAGLGEVIRAVYERNEVAVRSRDSLPLYKGFYSGENHPTETVIIENGIKIYVDFEHGQKTGYFLDQKSNRKLLRNYAKGKKVLDTFTHTGGFALNCAYGGASFVTAVDLSKIALSQAKRNAVLNGLDAKIEFVQADVPEYLDHVQPGEYDMIILDPPAFTKSRRTVNHAYNGYKRINKRAMEILPEGGILATCSCSRYMETGLFETMIQESAEETGKSLKTLSVTFQNEDHPILPELKNTEYLKFFVFEVHSK